MYDKEILKKELDVIGNTRNENKNTKDFRIAIAISNGDNDWLDPEKVSKSTIGNLYSIWLTTYIQGMNYGDKMIEKIIKNYDFRDDIIDNENIDTTLFEKYVNKEITYDEIIKQLLSK